MGSFKTEKDFTSRHKDPHFHVFSSAEDEERRLILTAFTLLKWQVWLLTTFSIAPYISFYILSRICFILCSCITSLRLFKCNSFMKSLYQINDKTHTDVRNRNEKRDFIWRQNTLCNCLKRSVLMFLWMPDSLKKTCSIFIFRRYLLFRRSCRPAASSG